jgi:hypothetical protein
MASWSGSCENDRMQIQNVYDNTSLTLMELICVSDRSSFSQEMYALKSVQHFAQNIIKILRTTSSASFNGISNDQR